MKHRGFSLIEVMVALALSGIFVAAVSSVILGGMNMGADQRRAFSCMTIAEQMTETLSFVPTNSEMLEDVASGSVSDPSSSTGVDGPAPAARRRNAMGDIDPNGPFNVFYKVEAGFGITRRIAVYCEVVDSPDARFVRFETIR